MPGNHKMPGRCKSDDDDAEHNNMSTQLTRQHNGDEDAVVALLVDQIHGQRTALQSIVTLQRHNATLTEARHSRLARKSRRRRHPWFSVQPTSVSDKKLRFASCRRAETCVTGMPTVVLVHVRI